MNFFETLWNWLARKLSYHLCNRLQAGAHCGLCGKWVPHVIAEKSWAWTLCDKCAKGEFE